MDDSAAIVLVLRQIMQISIVALGVHWFVGRFARHRPRLAHGLWLLVLAKALTPPVFSAPFAPLGYLDGWVTSHWQNEMPPSAMGRDAAWHPYSSRAARSDVVANASKSEPPEASGARHRAVFRSGEAGREKSLADAHRLRFWSSWLLGFWFLSSVWIACRMLMRVQAFIRETRRTTVETPEWLLSMVEDLRDRLGTVRAVRVRVVDSPIGPAVVGWWRPTIVISQALLVRGSATDLEPLLAHEMIHVRRGDLSWSLVQAAATIVWWFHPLVRLAARSLEREAERSCDDETMARLACSPARYARSLLHVLEQKHRFRAAPVFPGVRPMDVTSERMERIMRQGQGSYRAMPRWVPGIGVVLALGILPGTAWVEETRPEEFVLRTAAKEKSGHEAQRTAGDTEFIDLFRGDSDFVFTKDGHVHAKDIAPPTLLIKSYEVGNLIKKLCEEQKADRRTVEEEISVPLPGFLPQNHHQPDANRPKMEFDVPGYGRLELGGDGRQAQVVGDTLYVLGDSALQEAFEQSLAAMDRYGLRQVTISTRMITISDDKLKSLDVGWKTMVHPGSEPASNAFASSLPMASPVHVTLAAVLDSAEAQRLQEEWQSDRRTNILQAPRVTVFNGQSATIRDTRERPFVVAVDQKLTPLVRVIGEGTEIQVRPELQKDSQEVQLSLLLQYSTVVRVDELTFRHAGANAGQGTTLQVPQMQTHQLEVRQFALGLDQTLLLGAVPLQLDADNKSLMLVMVDVDVVEGSR